MTYQERFLRSDAALLAAYIACLRAAVEILLGALKDGHTLTEQESAFCERVRSRASFGKWCREMSAEEFRDWSERLPLSFGSPVDLSERR